MKTSSELIEDLAEMGTRFALCLRDGTYYEGYILDVGPENFEFEVGGPMAPEAPLVIEYDVLDFESLSYFDKDERCYKDAVWSNSENRWIISKSK